MKPRSPSLVPSLKSHDQDRSLRTFWMEKADEMVARLLRQLHRKRRNDVVLIVTGDHSSPVSYGDHTCEPVPIIFTDVFDPDGDEADDAHNGYIHADDCKLFTEIYAGTDGSLGRFPASEIMRIIKSLLALGTG